MQRSALLRFILQRLAIAIPLLHGMFNIGDLAIYTAAAWAVAIGKGA